MTLQDKDLLINVEKPSRYLDGEWNSHKGEIGRGLCSIALAYPDSYEIAQSSLGLKILYHIINSHPRACAQRVFAPLPDMEAFLRENKIPLTVLESGTPLKEFDILGFTLQYPLTYTNLPLMLDLSDIPLYSRDRGDEHPLLVAGGPCAVNPEPVADFFDAVLLGDGEEAVVEMIDLVNYHKDQGFRHRESLLKEFSRIPGVYVPSLYQASYPRQDRPGFVTPLQDTKTPSKITRRFLKDLDTAPFPVAPVVPFVETVHDRVMIEIFRGCTRGCRFCQAGFIYRPVRERSAGYDEISLLSLSSTDCSSIKPLLEQLSNLFSGRGISLSLPSLRMDSSSLDLLNLIKTSRRSSLTFAPEAGTQRLRDVINKNITHEDFISTIIQARDRGWKSVKLYFMMGLPSENREDLDGIIKMVHEARKQTGMKLNVSVSNFVPQPHTPFQWEPFEEIESLTEKAQYLKKNLRHRNIKFNYHDPKVSYLESVLSRGDRRLAGVIEEAYRSGARFDSWSDYFDFNRWMEAFRRRGLDPEIFTREIDVRQVLPWDHLSVGIDKEFLVRERIKAFTGHTTGDCRSGCIGCGICQAGGLSNLLKPDISGELTDDKIILSTGPENIHNQALRLRLRMARHGALRWISHLDAQRALERGLRRAGIPMSYTEGYHPRPRISFALPLPLGCCSESEWVDLTLYRQEDPLRVKEKLNKSLPGDFQVLRIRHLSGDTPALTSQVLKSVFTAQLPPEIDVEELQHRIGDLMSREEVLIQKKNRTVNARPFIDRFYLKQDEQGRELVLEIIKNQKGSIKADQVMDALPGEKKHRAGHWCRRELLVRRGRGWETP